MRRNLMTAGLVAALLGATTFAAPTRGGLKHWKSSGQPVGSLAVDAVSPTTVYGLGSIGLPSLQPGVWTSQDAGRSWSLNAVSGALCCARAIAVDPSAPGAIYVGDLVSGTGRSLGALFKTVDRGLTWQALPIPDGGVSAVAVDPVRPEILYVGGVAPAALGRGVGYRSADGGETWSPFGAGFPKGGAGKLLVDRQVSDRIFAAYDGSDGVFESSDAGATWHPSNEGLTNLFVHALVQDPRTDYLYAGTNAGLFESRDAGATWSAMASFPTVLRVDALVVNPRLGALYVASKEMGVQESFDGGVSWFQVGSGLPDTSFSDLAVSSDGSILYASTSAGVYTFELRLAHLVPTR